MTKFKVGDKIEVLNGMCNGKIGFITGITVEHGETRLWGLWNNSQGIPTYFIEEENKYKLIKGVKRTMDDLKAGDVVVVTQWGDEYRRTVLARIDNLVALSGDADQGAFRHWVSIKTLEKGGYHFPSEAKEMTVAEVEKLVGHKVKIVKG